MTQIVKNAGMLMGTPVDSQYLEMSAKRDQLVSVEKGYIERHSGKGFKVNKGQVFRIIQADGPQIGDVWVFNQHDTKEHFMGHTTFLYEAHTSNSTVSCGLACQMCVRWQLCWLSILETQHYQRTSITMLP